MLDTAYGGLTIQDGAAQTQALTTTPGQMVAWSAAKGGNGAASSGDRDGDPGVRPDAANNRILVQGPPGPIPASGNAPYAVYYVDFDISVVGGAAGPVDVIVQLRKNGVAIADMSCRFGTTSANRTFGSFNGFIRIDPSDNPKNLATMAAASTSGFGGASGAPLSEVPIDVTLATVSSTITVTIEAAHLTLIRMR